MSSTYFSGQSPVLYQPGESPQVELYRKLQAESLRYYNCYKIIITQAFSLQMPSTVIPGAMPQADIKQGFALKVYVNTLSDGIGL